MGYDVVALATPRALSSTDTQALLVAGPHRRAADALTSSDARTLRAGGQQIPIVRFDPSKLSDLRNFGSATVVVAFEQEDLERESKLIGRLHRQCDDLHIVPAMRGLPLFGTRVHYFFRHELFFLTLGNNLSRPGARAVKRLFDMIAASAISILCLPIFAYLAVRIRKDGGPLFFAHERIGQNGAPFRCLKFRTMVPNAQAVLDQLLARDSAAREEWNRDFKLRDDPRITSIGRFLRKYSLDELPQLWNVLKGEMSLVGPRPIVESEQERYGEDLEYYLETKPGMSGLWQISGRNDTGYDTRVYLDTWYAKNWSLWMDIVILIKTARVVLKNEGAY
jgi:undecaprenyl-phosphate galactose phosphotransferase